MSYCRYCGTKIENDDIFCGNCGKRIQRVENYSNKSYSDENVKDIDNALKTNASYKFCCMLAYFGAFFWAPLLFFPNEKNTKYYSNQGLWILIVSALSGWILHFTMLINGLLRGTFLGVITGGVYALTFTFFLILSIYIFVECIRAIRDLMNYKKPESILFFSEKEIIK